VLTRAGITPAAIHIRAGRIVSIAPYEVTATGCPVADAGDLIVFPGLVDTHVHLNEPGRSEWEGFATGTRAAAAGGVTTIVEMPLNSIPATTSVTALKQKREAAAGQCSVDVGFWGGLVPGNAGEIAGLAAAGIRGFKCFLVPAGVDEFPHVEKADLRDGLAALAALTPPLPLLAHAELPGPIDAATRALDPRSDPRSYEVYLSTRPPEAEYDAIDVLVRLAREFRTPIHIVHLAAASAVPLLRDARREGLPVSVETCPHYLTFAAEDVPDGATAFKCAPPIREQSNREDLWQALDDVIDLVVSDHSPAPPHVKCLDSGDFLRAWGGVASLELGLPVIWTAASARGYGVGDVARWMGERPARLAGLDRHKGVIAPGGDADFVVWDPDASWTVSGAQLQHRHAVTPYEGRTVRGVVQATILRGRVVFQDGEFNLPQGVLL
jgi:allantoinase